MNKIFGLVGAGGYGREIISYIKNSSDIYEVYFIDKNIKKNNINGINVIEEKDFLNIESDNKFFNISIADSIKREEISLRFLENGISPLELHSKTFINHEHNELDIGSVFSDFTIMSPNVKIGKFFHANRFSQIGHDSIIGDYVTFAPHVNCNGNVHIEDFVYIGTGAIIKHGTEEKPITIGRNSIIGMGAVVTKSVPSDTTVIGNPARDIKIIK